MGQPVEGMSVQCLCDNASVVAIVNSGRSKVERVMHLMRSLFFFLARWNVVLVCQHIAGAQNGAADALSHNFLPETGARSKTRPHGHPGAADESPGVGAAGLDHSELDHLAHHFFLKGLASSTLRVYQSAQRRYGKVCAEDGLQAVPASEEGLCRFVAKLAGDGLKHSTIKSYLAGVRHLHIEEGLADP